MFDYQTEQFCTVQQFTYHSDDYGGVVSIPGVFLLQKTEFEFIHCKTIDDLRNLLQDYYLCISKL